jgi:protein-tyrosine phosphatase
MSDIKDVGPIIKKVYPNLYLGNYLTVLDGKKLKKYKINIVYNMAIEINHTMENILFKKYNWIDDEKFDLTNEIESVVKEIKKDLENGNKIFIHCIEGLNRSPSVVCLFLYRYANIYLPQEKKMLRDVPSIINNLREKYKGLHGLNKYGKEKFILNNVGFVNQLELFDDAFDIKCGDIPDYFINVIIPSFS